MSRVWIDESLISVRLQYNCYLNYLPMYHYLYLCSIIKVITCVMFISYDSLIHTMYVADALEEQELAELTD